MNLPADETLAGDSFGAPPPATINGKVILGEWSSVDELVQIMRKRADELNVTRLGIDEGAGLPSGYAGKVLSPTGSRGMGPRTLQLMVVALGLKMLVVENAEAMKRYTDRIEKRKHSSNAGSGMPAVKTKRKWGFSVFRGNPEAARMIRAHQVLSTPARRRKEIARTAAKARWAKHRAMQAAAKLKIATRTVR